MAYDLTARLSLVDRFSGPMSKATKSVEMLDKSVGLVSKSTESVSRSVNSASSAFRKMREAAAASCDSVTSKIAGTIAAIGGITLATKGLTASFKGASDLEQNMISMEHFIGLTQGVEKAKSATKDYVEYLRQNANLTPFATTDVMSAGRRAVNISTGNIDQAKKLLGIAEDMASLNPGKSLMDAMEAIADLTTGDTERMKEFGFKISQDDIQKAGGAMNVINGKIAKTFAGGSQELAGSGAGIWSTITGTFSSGIADMGTKALEKAKVPLQKIADAMNSGSLDRFIGKGSDMLAALVDKAVAFGEWLVKIKPLASAAFRSMRDDLAPISKVFDVTGKAAKFAAEFILNNWGDIKPIFYGVAASMAAATAAQWALNVAMAANPVGLVAAGVGVLIGAGYLLVKHWDEVKAKAQELWGYIEPLGRAFMMPLGPIKELLLAGASLIVHWDTVSEKAKGMWDSISYAFMTGVNESIALINKLISVINKIPGVSVDYIDPIVSKKSYNGLDVQGTSRYNGISYVPADGTVIRAHKGEMVVPKTQADAIRSGGGSPVTVNLTYNAGRSTTPREDAQQMIRILADELATYQTVSAY